MRGLAKWRASSVARAAWWSPIRAWSTAATFRKRRARLRARRMEVFAFHDFTPGPTTAMVDAGAAYAAPLNIDLIVGVGGGSSLDCAKAINFVLTNGGSIRDYWGYGKASRAMLPMIAVPTTAGTGSEAQTYAVVTDPETHAKMICGDTKAAFRAAILDPKLTVSMSRGLTASTGYDAISHAVETLVSTRRNALSDCFSRSAWRMLNASYERVLKEPDDLDARGAMLLGAYFGGMAMENSMLGAAHACATPLTTQCGIGAWAWRWAVCWRMSSMERRRRLAILRRTERGRSRGPFARSGASGRFADVAAGRGSSRVRVASARRGSGLAMDGEIQPARLRCGGALEIYQNAY